MRRVAQLGRGLGDALQADERALDLGIERQRLAGRHQPGAATLEQHQPEHACCRSRIMRLTAGWVTFSSLAAAPTLPVRITARNASIWRGFRGRACGPL